MSAIREASVRISGGRTRGGRLARYRPDLFRFVPSRVAAIVALLAASSIVFTYAAGSYITKRSDNATVAALAAGEDIGIDPSRADEMVVLARLHYLLSRDRIDEAQSLLDQAAPYMGREARADALYNMANARLRVAFSEIEKRDLDRAVPLVRLAKDDYRRALAVRPENWDYKFNLDVAMRLVRDFPEQGSSADEETEEGAKRVWTDLPGIPRGLP